MKKRHKLIWQLYPSYLIIIIISLIAVSGYTLNALEAFILKQTKKDLQIRGYIVENQLLRHISPLDTKHIDQFCKQVGGKSDTRITVVLKDGNVIGDTDENPISMDNHAKRPEIAAAFQGDVSSSIRYSETLKQKMMYTAIPLSANGKIIGSIRTAIPVTDIEKVLHMIRVRIIWGGIFISFLASIVCLIVSKRISKPIEDLKNGAKRFAIGDLKHRLHEPSTRELSRLARSMNHMAVQLEERIETVIQQRNEYEAVLASMTEGVMAVDKDERILTINQAAVEILFIEVPKIKGRSIPEVIRNKDFQSFIKTSIESDRLVEEDIVRRRDSDQIINAVSVPLKDAANRHIGVLVVFNDVTQIRALENMRRDFAANVSHELKTPLTAIKGFVETLKDSAIQDPKNALRFLTIIDKHVNRLSFIIDDLLKLSRIEKMNEKDELQAETCPLNTILNAAVALCYTKAKEKGIRILFESKEEYHLSVDASLMEQAFVNLLDNAVNYSEANSDVQIRTRATAHTIEIAFSDNGVGIPSQHLNRLFERFYRVDKARSRKVGGTGLGLAIVKHIVQAHNGRVSVDSTVGLGSTFRITLPKTSV